MQVQSVSKMPSAGPSAKPELPAGRPLDLVHLSRQTLGDRALELELLGLFDKQAGQIVDRLDSGLCNSDQKWRRDLAHTLKGSARAIGAVRVAAAAQAYEDALVAQAEVDIQDQLVELLKSCVDEVRQAIGELLADA